ncbi:MAG TPA: DUF1499 domain-containing protein [Longimicrobium sp.]|nr:DUF1499 domain-containing protein [Longimicrobium sp.]
MSDEIPAPRPGPGPGRPLAILALLLGVIGAAMVVLAGPGTKMGWWTFITGLRTLFKWGAYLGLAAIVLAIVAMLVARRRAGRGTLAMGIAAVLLGLVAFGIPWGFRHKAQGVPPIHDITTNWVNPPELVQSRALRDTSSEHLNTAAYEGDRIAAQQLKAYPDIQPVMLAMSPDQAYAAALKTAQEMGWQDIDANRDARTVEAVAVTGWFGFKDDVAIRVTPASGISRVDIRSVSRVGRSDVGANAARIRKYVARLKADNKDRVAGAQ